MAERLSRFPGFGRPGWRRAAWWALVTLVLLVHGGVLRQISARIAEFKLATTMPKRIEVAFVREMALAEPPVVAVAAPPAPRPRPRAPRPARAASAPQPAASVPDVTSAKADPVPADVVAQAPPAPAVEAASAVVTEPIVPAPPASAATLPAEASLPPALAQTAAAAASIAASAALPFDWPESTRISYALTGNYRGEVQGSAQVEWIRAGSRYQVHLDIVIGPSMAPLITRRMSSDGELTAEGLSPHRYDEDTKAVFRDRRRVTMLFEPDAVVMASGQRRERLPGVQDTASQFVQLTYLFTTRPELLRVGQQFEVPLALPRNIDRWTYDVVKEEILYTPFGEVPSFHVKPRRVSRPGGELSIEIWFSPQLRYLPVRIRIEQDPETFVDLVLDRRPQIAGP